MAWPDDLQGPIFASKPNKFSLYAALILAQIAFAGFELITRAALYQGVNALVFSLYRNVIASAVLLPVAYFLERELRPRLTLRSFLVLNALGFLGVTANQLFYLIGLNHTSTVLASALRNVTPSLTFILATICRAEKINIRRLDGRAKVLGTILGLVGAVFLSIQPQSSPSSQQVVQTATFTNGLTVTYNPWDMGVVCLILSFLSFAIFLIMTASFLRDYPAALSIGAASCFFSTIQLGVFSLILVKPSDWLFSNIEEGLSILYAGMIGSGLVSGIQAWGVKKGGPVIVAAYQPLETVIVTLISFFFFQGTFHVNSGIGAVLVVIGLYILTWGQEQERKMKCINEANEISIKELLQNLIEAPLEG